MNKFPITKLKRLDGKIVLVDFDHAFFVDERFFGIVVGADYRPVGLLSLQILRKKSTRKIARDLSKESLRIRREVIGLNRQIIDGIALFSRAGKQLELDKTGFLIFQI